MKKLLMLAVAASTALIVATPGPAAQGCGRNYHRAPSGRCIRNWDNRPTVGRFYRGRGYWDGHRYWQHRYRHHNGWRYR